MEEARFVLGLELLVTQIILACCGLYFLAKMLWDALSNKRS